MFSSLAIYMAAGAALSIGERPAFNGVIAIAFYRLDNVVIGDDSLFEADAFLMPFGMLSVGDRQADCASSRRAIPGLVIVLGLDFAAWT